MIMQENIYFLYAVKDVVTGKFSKPDLFVNEASALRWFDQLVNESKIGKDLQLFMLGTMNIETGDIQTQLIFKKGGANVNV